MKCTICWCGPACCWWGHVVRSVTWTRLAPASVIQRKEKNLHCLISALLLYHEFGFFPKAPSPFTMCSRWPLSKVHTLSTLTRQAQEREKRPNECATVTHHFWASLPALEKVKIRQCQRCSLWMQHEVVRGINKLQVWFMSEVSDILSGAFNCSNIPPTVLPVSPEQFPSSRTSLGDLQCNQRHIHLKKEVIW